MKKIVMVIAIINLMILTSCHNSELQELQDELIELSQDNKFLENELFDKNSELSRIEDLVIKLDQQINSLEDEKSVLLNENINLIEERSSLTNQNSELKENLSNIDESYRIAKVSQLKYQLKDPEMYLDDRNLLVMNYLDTGRTYIGQELDINNKIVGMSIKDIEVNDYSITLELRGTFKFNGYISFNEEVSKYELIKDVHSDQEEEQIDSVIIFGSEGTTFYSLYVGYSFFCDNGELIDDMIDEEYRLRLKNGDVFYIESTCIDYSTYKKIESETISNSNVLSIENIVRVDRSILNNNY